jgi:hypothetical protein
LDDPEVRNATEIYLVGRYGETLRADSFWKSAVMQNLGDRRRTANAILERHPNVSAEELARATEIVEEGRRQRAGRQRDRGSAATIAGPIVGALGMLSVIMVLGLSLVSSLIVPGGLLARALGLAVVTRDGLEVTRARSLVRTMVAWAPAFVWLGYLISGPKIQGWVPAGAVQLPVAAAMFGVLAIGAVWSIVTPSRGPHDRVVGTWIVPR